MSHVAINVVDAGLNIGERTSRPLDIVRAIKDWNNENQIYERKSTNKEHKEPCVLDCECGLHDCLHEHIMSNWDVCNTQF